MAVAEPQIAPSESRRLITYDEFEAFLALPENARRHFELIDGIIVEKPSHTEEHGVTGGNLHGHLWMFNREQRLGYVVFEVLYRDPADPENARQPDLSFTLNRDEPVVKKGAVARMPDLAIEVKSPNDTYKELRERAHYYLEHGTQIVWLVYPAKRQIEVLTADDFELLSEGDVLNGGDLLPGFSLAVADVFAAA
jgi:Uma2 family endonuclease